MTIFSDMFGSQCAECSQDRITSHDYTASLDDNTKGDINTDNIRGDINTDNTRGDINTAAGGTQDTDYNSVKPTQLPGIHTICGSGYSFYIDKCDECNSSATKGSKCAEEASLVELAKNLDNLSISQNDVNKVAHSSKLVSKKDGVCSTCHKKLNIYKPLSKQLAAVHIRIHTGQNASSSAETIHRPNHKRKKYYLCHKCGKAFSGESNRDSHNRICTGEKSSFRIHTGEKSCFSDGHENALSNQVEKTKHSRAHNGEKHYKCCKCDKSYKYKCNLNAHVRRIHEDERRFLCDVCDRSFFMKSELTRHKHWHTGMRPFTCRTCSKSFRTQSDRSAHNRLTHIREKKYFCSQCSRAFFRKSHLSQHIKWNHLQPKIV